MTTATEETAAAVPGESFPPPSGFGGVGRTFRRVHLLATVAFLALVFVPILAIFAEGLLFGGDWGQYALTSQLYVNHQSNMLYYPEPVLPVLYLPITLLFGSSLAVGYAADLFGGVLLVAIYFTGYPVFREVSGSPWGGLAGALLVATSPLMMDEVGWAGQAQFLAIAFGLAATWVLLRKVAVEGRERWALVAGVLLGLAVLSESYSALYFLVSLFVWLLFTYRSRILGRSGLLRAVAVFVLPLLALGALGLANSGLASNVISEPLVARVAYLPLFKALYLRFAFDSYVLLVLYPSIAVAYLLLWRRLTYGNRAFRWFAPALLLAWIPQFLLFTPVVDTDRALYFAFLPAAAMVALLAGALPAVWTAAVSDPGGRPLRTRWGRIPRGRRSIVPILAVIAVVTIGAQAGVSAHSYYGSLTYYGYDAGVLSELSLLESKNGSLLLLTPNLGNFASSWASGRNTFFGPPSQPATYTRSDQQLAVIDGNLLAYGASWIHAGNTWAIDAEPEWEAPAPLILQFSGQYLFQALEMNDSLSWIEYSPASEPSVVENVSLFSAPSIVHSVGPAEIATTYAWPGLSVTKTLSTDLEGNITIALRFSFVATVPRAVGLTLTLPNPRHTVETTYQAAVPSSLKVVQVLKNGFLPFPFPDTVGLTASGFSGTTTFVGPSANLSVAGAIVSRLEPTSPSATNYSATFSIAPGGMSSLPSVTVGEASILSANGISWVAVERSMGSGFLERFLNDPEFSLYAASPHYLFFETNWG